MRAGAFAMTLSALATALLPATPPQLPASACPLYDAYSGRRGDEASAGSRLGAVLQYATPELCMQRCSAEPECACVQLDTTADCYMLRSGACRDPSSLPRDEYYSVYVKTACGHAPDVWTRRAPPADPMPPQPDSLLPPASSAAWNDDKAAAAATTRQSRHIWADKATAVSEEGHDWTVYWQPTRSSETLTIYVQMDKTGSSMLKRTLLEVPPETLCVIDSRNIRESLFHFMPYTPDPSKMRVCRDSAVLIGPEATFGACAAVAPRRCQYLTLLREPAARYTSEYNYFCRACAERRRFCGGNAWLPPTGCPNDISFIDWVMRAPNQYTQHFRKSWWGVRWGYLQQLTHGFPNHSSVTSLDLAHARQVLTGKDDESPMLAVCLELLDVGGWAMIDRWLGGGSIKLARTNKLLSARDSNVHAPADSDYKPTEAELVMVRDVINRPLPRRFGAGALRSSWPAVAFSQHLEQQNSAAGGAEHLLRAERGQCALPALAGCLVGCGHAAAAGAAAAASTFLAVSCNHHFRAPRRTGFKYRLPAERLHL